jgi:hypothetical protein
MVLSMQPLALAAVVLPPVAMVVRPRRLVPAGLSYLAGLALLAAWFSAVNADIDWADRTGGAGNALAGAGWFFGAMAAATGAVLLGRRTAPAS